MDDLKSYVSTFPRQADAAEALGIAAPYLSQLLSGRRRVSPEMALQLERRSAGKIRKESLIWPAAS